MSVNRLSKNRKATPKKEAAFLENAVRLLQKNRKRQNDSVLFVNAQDVFRLRSFGTVSYFKLDILPLRQRFIAVAGNRAVMHENILFAGLFDKPVTFRVVEPFDLTDCF